jgi:hypothetical protein
MPRRQRKRTLKTRRRRRNSIRRKRSRVRRHRGGNISNSHPGVNNIHNKPSLSSNNVDMNDFAKAHLSNNRIVITKIE